jgi:hypothetical protein
MAMWQWTMPGCATLPGATTAAVKTSPFLINPLLAVLLCAFHTTTSALHHDCGDLSRGAEPAM